MVTITNCDVRNCNSRIRSATAARSLSSTLGLKENLPNTKSPMTPRSLAMDASAEVKGGGYINVVVRRRQDPEQWRYPREKPSFSLFAKSMDFATTGDITGEHKVPLVDTGYIYDAAGRIQNSGNVHWEHSRGTQGSPSEHTEHP